MANLFLAGTFGKFLISIMLFKSIVNYMASSFCKDFQKKITYKKRVKDFNNDVQCSIWCLNLIPTQLPLLTGITLVT